MQDRLRRAHDEGRLDLVEFDERVRTVWAARTRGELAGLTADLPLPGPAPARGGVFSAKPGGVAMRVLTLVWISIVVVNLTVWGIVSLTIDEPVYPWWLWVAAPAGSVLAVLYAAGIGPPGADRSRTGPIRARSIAEPLTPQKHFRKAAVMTEPDLGPRRQVVAPTVLRPERPEIDGLLRAVARGDERGVRPALRPGRAAGVRAGPSRAARPGTGRGDGPGGARRGLAHRGPVRPGARNRPLVGLTIAHRRAVDRVRSEQASADRMQRVGGGVGRHPLRRGGGPGRRPVGAPAGAPLPRRSHRAAA